MTCPNPSTGKKPSRDELIEHIEVLVAEIERLRADNERLKEWCRKLIEAGEFPSSNEQ